MKDKKVKLEMCLLKGYVCPCHGAKAMIWSGSRMCSVRGPGF
jgi:hypothetical protein